jgi:hypothetical protein
MYLIVKLISNFMIILVSLVWERGKNNGIEGGGL